VSIRRKLTIIMLFIGLVPTVVVSIVAYITISRSLTQKTVDQLVSTASKQEQKINGLLQKKQEEAIQLTNKYDLQSTLGNYLSSGGRSGQSELSSILLDKKIDVPDIQTIYLVDLQGKVIATTLRGNEGKELPAQDYTVPDGKETNTTVREDERDGINKLYITTRVSVNKKEAASLIVIFRVDDIIAAVQDYTGLGATGETVVAERDANGNAVSLFPLRFYTDAARKMRLNSLELFTPYHDDYKDLVDYRGHAVMIAAKSIGFAEWAIATKIDKAEALAQIDQLRNTILAIVIGSSLAITVIALYLTRFFTQPILRIANAAKRIGRGDLSARIDMQRRSDEIGALGESINTMGASLKEFVSSIETQRTRLEVILNSTLESILAIDIHGNIVLANQAAAELTQTPADSIVGQNINDLFMFKQGEQRFEIDYNQPASKVYSDLTYTDKSGNNHYVRILVAPVSGEQEKKTAQTIVTIHDQTKSRELEDMKVDFVSMAAHELRTPLAAIRGYLELIRFKEGGDQESESSKFLAMALKSTSDLGGLINNLLDVTRIEKGTFTLNLEKVDLASEIKQALQDAHFTASEKQIILLYNGPEMGSFVIADKIALREVINNLISNAIKYTDSMGTVEVTLSQSDGKYSVSVKDSGVGISKQAQTHLFTKFYRVHGGLNSGSTGTGLGLFISKSIIERHEGTISCTSEEGVGSIFTFTIPMFTEERLAALEAAQKPELISTRKHHGWITKNTTR
jgi:PAS domain S-box-containing protein